MLQVIDFIRKSKLLKAFFGLIVIIIIVYGIIYNNHPIISKWVFGEAKIIGKPINATVYTDGQINKNIKVYRDSMQWDDETFNGYLLSLKDYDKYGMLKYIIIDLDDKLVCRPNGTSKDDYDSIYGFLLQSDVGYHFDDFKDDMKGYNFEPHLNLSATEIKFNVPPRQLKFDSVRIDLLGNKIYSKIENK